MMTGLVVIVATGLMAGCLLVYTRSRFTPASDDLIDLVNAELPQTQCAQCGYPGCRPYAEAIIQGEAINRCPPGGNATIDALATLLGRDALALDPACGEDPPPQVAVIREEDCIGCTLCLPACPVDAIVGAPRYLHTVIESACTGCELCLAPCPVDCIDLVELPAVAPPRSFLPQEMPCINCGACASTCPRDLQPQLLYWFREDTASAANHRLDQCIECRRCDAVCPSDIPLTHAFQVTKHRLQSERTARKNAEQTEQRYERHVERVSALASQVKERPTPNDRQALLDALREDS